MGKKNDFEIDLEVYKLELEGIDKIIDVAKLITVVGAPVSAGLLSQGIREWWQWLAFALLAGFVIAAVHELFRLTSDRNEIIAKMKQKYLGEKSKPKDSMTRIFKKKNKA